VAAVELLYHGTLKQSFHTTSPLDGGGQSYIRFMAGELDLLVATSAPASTQRMVERSTGAKVCIGGQPR
jgi:hypothetical protein